MKKILPKKNIRTRKSLKIKRNDTVKVLLGKDQGKTGKVMAVLPDAGRVLIEGVNLVKKHVKARRQGEKGQRVEVAAPLHISKVQLVCPQCKKPTRVGLSRADGMRQRVCKKCEAVIDTK